MIIRKAESNYIEKQEHPYKMVEKAGRICYKSESKIKEGTAEPFVEMMVKNHHFAMLEHGWVHFQVKVTDPELLASDIIEENPYIAVAIIGDVKDVEDTLLISGSLRSLRYENCPTLWLHGIGEELSKHFGTALATDANYHSVNGVKGFSLLTDEEVKEALQGDKEDIMKHIVHTVHFVCDRGVSHEFVRHRPCSFAQESTRYCDYQHDKHGSEITVIEPVYYENVYHNRPEYLTWARACEDAELRYMQLRQDGVTAQIARAVLPTCLKTELVITTTEKEWQHIINLRYKGTTGAPHPDMKNSMSLVVDTLVEKSEGRLTKE